MRKDKSHHQWISIADLMSGVLAVVMLMLVISILQSEVSRFINEQQAKELEIANKNQQDAYLKELNELKLKKTNMLKNILVTVENIAKNDDVEGLFKFDINAGKFILADGTFNKGSACITPQMQEALGKIATQMAEFLKSDNKNLIFIEGHTDSLGVAGPVTDFMKNCTVYDDNYTLSASRAREARKLFLTNLSEEQRKRVIVAGYGDSVPIDEMNTESALNRRVEIRLVLNDQ